MTLLSAARALLARHQDNATFSASPEAVALRAEVPRG